MQSCSLAAVLRALPLAPPPPPPKAPKKLPEVWSGWPDSAPYINKQVIVH